MCSLKHCSVALSGLVVGTLSFVRGEVTGDNEGGPKWPLAGVSSLTGSASVTWACEPRTPGATCTSASATGTAWIWMRNASVCDQAYRMRMMQSYKGSAGEKATFVIDEIQTPEFNYEFVRERCVVSSMPICDTSSETTHNTLFGAGKRYVGVGACLGSVHEECDLWTSSDDDGNDMTFYFARGSARMLASSTVRIATDVQTSYTLLYSNWEPMAEIDTSIFEAPAEWLPCSQHGSDEGLVMV